MRKKILCYINHYYKYNPQSIYKSGISNQEDRLAIIKRCINALKELDAIAEIDIKVCGITGRNLVNIDIDFSHLDNPQMLIYESLKNQVSHVEGYDYIINCEDDILFNKETLLNVFDFDRLMFPNEILHPNRIEFDKNGNRFCVDLVDPWWNRWTLQRKVYKGHELRVSVNPHSAVLILSKEKVDYLVHQIDINKFEKLLHGYMASAYAFFHTPFSLLRSYADLDFHYVEHLDKWVDPQIYGNKNGGIKTLIKKLYHKSLRR